MNNVTLTGRIFNVPRIRVLRIDGKAVNICNFTIAVADGISEQGSFSEHNTDFFECVCFGDAALAVNANFIKGSKISCYGKVKNHFFEDANRTKHFTQVFVVYQVEFGDTSSAFDKNTEKKKSIDLSVISELKDVTDLFGRICDNGYLCIDEDEYYRIAMDNFLV